MKHLLRTFHKEIPDTSPFVVAVHYGLEKLNEEVSAWMMGLTCEDGTKSRPPFLAMGSSQSVMWNRDFGQERFQNLQQRWKACMDVEGMLKLLGARQLIIGHTPQVACHIYCQSMSHSIHPQVRALICHTKMCFSDHEEGLHGCGRHAEAVWCSPAHHLGTRLLYPTTGYCNELIVYGIQTMRAQQTIPTLPAVTSTVFPVVQQPMHDDVSSPQFSIIHWVLCHAAIPARFKAADYMTHSCSCRPSARIVNAMDGCGGWMLACPRAS